LLHRNHCVRISLFWSKRRRPWLPPSLGAKRVADLEAYVTNSPRGADIGFGQQLEHRLRPAELQRMDDDVRRPLVLFMTLPRPGALFYGGAGPSKKTLLSVLAQCLAIAGWVTILWGQ